MAVPRGGGGWAVGALGGCQADTPGRIDKQEWDGQTLTRSSHI